MTNTLLFLSISIFSNGAIGIFAAGLLYLLSLNFGNSYQRYWAIGWLSLSLYALTGGAILILRMQGNNTSPWLYSLSYISQWVGYASAAFFYLGARRIWGRPDIDLKSWVALILGISIWAYFTSTAFSAPELRAERFLLKVGGRALFSMIFMGLAVAMILRFYRSHSKKGPRIFAYSLLAYVCLMGIYLALAIDLYLGGQWANYLAASGVAEFVIQLFMIYGFVLWAVEDEHEKFKRLQSILQAQAWRDTLTGLHNRRWFDVQGQKQLNALNAEGRKVAIVFFDLDGFKKVNDALGHKLGDELLVRVAGILAKKIGSEDLLCRLGGNEFVALWADGGSAEKVEQRAHELLNAIKAVDQISGHAINISCSIGVSFGEGATNDLVSLTARSDQAMYLAKNEGRNRVVIAH